MIAIPPGALRQLVSMLTQLGQGRAVTVLLQNAELTTEEVADYLNVSRPKSGHAPPRPARCWGWLAEARRYRPAWRRGTHDEWRRAEYMAGS